MRCIFGPLCHGACNKLASPAPSLPRPVLDARRRAYSRATALCLRSPPALLLRRRCATALASDNPCSPACGLQAATSSHPAPRQRLRHWLRLSCRRRPAGADFYVGLARCHLPAACAISFAHGCVGYAGRCPVSAAHRFRACPAGPAGRDRPPATALPLAPRHGGSGPLPRRWRARWPAVPVISGWHTAARRLVLRGPPPLTCGEAVGSASGRVSLQGQDRATCCIAHPFGGYAENPAASHLSPAPFRRSHKAKANPLCGIASQRPNQLALRVCWLEPARVLAALDCTPPGSGKSLRD